MMKMNSREIAGHLYRYAALLRSEHERAYGLGLLEIDEYGHLARRAQEVLDLANSLHEAKVNIDTSA